MAGIGPLLPYYSYPRASGDGTVDHDDDTFVALLLDSGHTVDRAAHTEISDVEGDELAEVNGYERVELEGVTWAQGEDDDEDKAIFSSDPIVFAADGGPITARYLVVASSTSGKLVGVAEFLDQPGGSPADLVITDTNSVTLQPTTGLMRHRAVTPE